MKELNVGDVIYRMYHGEITNKMKIERVTKTQAISGNYKFRRYYDSWISAVGERGSFVSYSISDNKLDEEYVTNILIRKINNVNLRSLSINKLVEISNIIDLDES